MIYFSDGAVIRGLREKRADCIRFLYREYFPLAKSFVTKNSGSYEDAEDVFQDGIMVLFQKSCEGDLILKCSLKTYFYSICRNIWLQRLDRKWRLLYQDNLVHESDPSYDPDPLGIDEEKLERTRIYQHHFLSLPEDCQKILMLFLKKVPFREIASMLGFRDDQAVKTRKYLCKNMLRKRILKDPQCKNLMHYE
ncbi:MAG TPA: sigma-70 family RNA polymerase sigma factor [Bacteroidales bacterium]|nr:sigma-70 family RNA polymerase sigma factor [Bacteroidales bacterium]